MFFRSIMVVRLIPGHSRRAAYVLLAVLSSRKAIIIIG